MNQHFEDELKTPGYREWEAVELRSLLHQHGFSAGAEGCWRRRGKGLGLVVTRYGLFVGWIDQRRIGEGESVEMLADARHLPKGSEAADLGRLVDELERLRKASMIQCRGCGEPFDPGRMNGRHCEGCAG